LKSATGEILSGVNDLAERKQAAAVEESSAAMDQLAAPTPPSRSARGHSQRAVRHDA
jgi:hypothetical protein